MAKVHRPEPSAGDAFETLAQQTPLSAIARTADKTAIIRIIPGS
jgi:hypothetical protein